MPRLFFNINRMKNIVSTLFFLLSIPVLVMAQYDANNISLFAIYDDTTVTPEPFYDIRYQSCWGWYQVTKNKEYGIIGSSKGTHIVEVTDPSNPVLRDYVAGRRDSCIWREYKTYGNYLYAISDDSYPNSLQIIDLSYLPDSVHVVHDADSILTRAHTLFEDNGLMYFASVKHINPPSYSHLEVYDVASDPLHPTLLRKIEQDDSTVGGSHDMFVRGDTVYLSAAYSGLKIYKYDRQQNKFSKIGELPTYPQQGYNHSSSLTSDGKTLIMCDEVGAGLAVKSVDVSDFMNISVVDTFRSNVGATPHNPYCVGNDRVVIAYYKDGVQIFDISDPANPIRTGYFDTHPQNGTDYLSGDPYAGCWAAYYGLPSKTLIASDMQNGMFVLNASAALNVQKQTNVKQFLIYPNPAKDQVEIVIPLIGQENVVVSIFDVIGNRVALQTHSPSIGNNSFKLNIAALSVGSYMIEVRGESFSYSQKILKVK